MSDSFINVASSGSSPVAVFEQVQNATTVFVQQAALVDPNSGQPSVIDANGWLQIRANSGTQRSSGPLSVVVNFASSGIVTAPGVTIGKTGYLQHAVLSANQPSLWTLQTVANNGAATNVASFYSNALESVDFRAMTWNEVVTQLASSASCAFQITCANQSTNQNINSQVYAQFFWAEN